MPAPEQSVVHAYGVVETAAELTLPPSGISGAVVTRAACGDYTVISSSHPESELGEAIWEERGQNPHWIGTIAAEHHAVLQALIDQVDVLPLRLPGIYLDERSMCEALAVSHGELRAVFETIRGHVEWGVQIFSRAVEARPPVQPRPTSGRDYLRMRSEHTAQRVVDREQRNAVLLDVHESLALAATRATLNPPRDRALTGRTEEMLFNGAYLVARNGQERFFEIVNEQAARHDADGYLLELSGPWPPYNFTETPMHSSETT